MDSATTRGNWPALSLTRLGELPEHCNVEMAGLSVGISIDLPSDAGHLAALLSAPCQDRLGHSAGNSRQVVSAMTTAVGHTVVRSTVTR